MNAKLYAALLVLNCVVTNCAWGALKLDRSRLVFNEGDKIVSLNVENTNQSEPYLVQSWLENEQGKKINAPLIALPPVQRIEPGGKTVVRIQPVPQDMNLSKTQETVFYLNVREIPVMTEKKNVLTLALQTRLKVFYRPNELNIKDRESMLNLYNALSIKKQNSGYQIINPTKYNMTVVEMNDVQRKSGIKGFSPLMIAPQSSVEVKTGDRVNQFELVVMNDFGGKDAVNIQIR